MTSRAMGADTSPPVPPPLATKTATAIFGASAGAKPMNQVWSGTSALTCAVPVLPATSNAVLQEIVGASVSVCSRGLRQDEPLKLGMTRELLGSGSSWGAGTTVSGV